jgi:nitrite reductase (NADH) small subunit
VALHLVTNIEKLEEAKASVHVVEGRSIGLIKVNDRIHAIRNVCPHKRAPVCKGQLRGTMLPSDPDTFVFGMENQVLQCPWHGWEFDLTTGHALCDGLAKKLTFYPVTLRDGAVYVEI